MEATESITAVIYCFIIKFSVVLCSFQALEVASAQAEGLAVCRGRAPSAEYRSSHLVSVLSS